MELLFECLNDVINDKLKEINNKIDKLSEIMYATPAKTIDRQLAGKISLEYQKASELREKWKQVKKLMGELLAL